jgi:4-amino-4-deoxy-L-arabinose transferase-like glycosyltransferase
LCAVTAGLVLGLGCLFASFAREFHQVLLSYGFFLGVGLGRTTENLSIIYYHLVHCSVLFIFVRKNPLRRFFLPY